MTAGVLMKTLPLFPNTIADDLVTAFEEWLAPQLLIQNAGIGRGAQRSPLNMSSARNYRDMWATFVSFCVAKNLTLETVRTSDLELFAQARSTRFERVKGVCLSDVYMNRFLRILIKVTEHACKGSGLPRNTAAEQILSRDRIKYARASHKEPLPPFFSVEDVCQLIDFIARSRTNSEAEGVSSWKSVRDITAVAMMLGAGCTPIDIRHLVISEALAGRDGEIQKLALPGNGNYGPREAPLESWAGQQLSFWLRVRRYAHISGTYVFPSNEFGNEWSETQCHTQCKAVLRKAAIENAKLGGIYRLRHTYALRQLNSGADEVELARWLGIRDISRIERYRRIAYDLPRADGQATELSVSQGNTFVKPNITPC